ncbi:MAG: glucosamine-6-phosphate deaminase [Ruminococcaceae bacterium]|nr:glucosamine-6-phosphate deaminase [Oscillospiraceae bacterium]
MQIIVCENYEELSKKGAELIGAEVMANPNAVLGLATGNTPIGIYRYLVESYQRGELDFSNVKTYNLDEYLPIDPADENSYCAFMHMHLWDKVNLKAENCHIPAGNVGMENAAAECAAYDKRIEAAGGIDLQLLGIGRNGHIGFNEPGDHLLCGTHAVELTESTIAANGPLFENPDDMPRHALTMGMGAIFAAKKVLLVANGKNKHQAIQGLLADKITTELPASLLKLHQNLILLCDKEAYNG